MEEDLLEKFDHLIKDTYHNRSEAIRDLIREKISRDISQQEDKEVIGSLVVIYDHHQRELTEKMLEIQHQYHHLFQSTMHLHLDHNNCMEIIAVRGNLGKLKQITQKLVGLKGVKLGKLTITAIDKVF